MYVLTNEKYTCDSGTLPESGVKIYDTEKGRSIHVNISEKQALAPLGCSVQNSLLRTCILKDRPKEFDSRLLCICSTHQGPACTHEDR